MIFGNDKTLTETEQKDFFYRLGELRGSDGWPFLSCAEAWHIAYSAKTRPQVELKMQFFHDLRNEFGHICGNGYLAHIVASAQTPEQVATKKHLFRGWLKKDAADTPSPLDGVPHDVTYTRAQNTDQADIQINLARALNKTVYSGLSWGDILDIARFAQTPAQADAKLKLAQNICNKLRMRWYWARELAASAETLNQADMKFQFIQNLCKKTKLPTEDVYEIVVSAQTPQQAAVKMKLMTDLLETHRFLGIRNIIEIVESVQTPAQADAVMRASADFCAGQMRMDKRGIDALYNTMTQQTRTR